MRSHVSNAISLDLSDRLERIAQLQTGVTGMSLGAPILGRDQAHMDDVIPPEQNGLPAASNNDGVTYIGKMSNRLRDLERDGFGRCRTAQPVHRVFHDRLIMFIVAGDEVDRKPVLLCDAAGQLTIVALPRLIVWGRCSSSEFALSTRRRTQEEDVSG